MNSHKDSKNIILRIATGLKVQVSRSFLLCVYSKINSVEHSALFKVSNKSINSMDKPLTRSEKNVRIMSGILKSVQNH